MKICQEEARKGAKRKKEQVKSMTKEQEYKRSKQKETKGQEEHMKKQKTGKGTREQKIN